MKILSKLTQFIVLVGLLSASNSVLSAKQRYIVGTEYSFPPFALIGREDKITGYDIELIKAIAAKQGFDIEIVILEWSEWLPTLEYGSVDIWVSGIAITAERQQKVAFSLPYLHRGTIAITQLDINKIDKESIDNLRIASQVGTPDYDYVSDLIDGTNAEAVPVISNYIGITSILTHKADILVGNDKVIKYYLNQHPEVKVAIIPIDTQNTDIAFAVKKGRENLLNQLNEGLGKVMIDETLYTTLNNKWFGEPIVFKNSDAE